MGTGSGRHYSTLAAIAVAVTLSAFIAAHRSPESGETISVGQGAGQDSPDLSFGKEQSVVNEDKPARSGDIDGVPAVTVEVHEGAGTITVEATEASLQEVLEGLTARFAIEVQDLRSGEEIAAHETRLGNRSFRFSGSMEDVLRQVMNAYQYSYALSFHPSVGEPARGRVVRLYLYGTVQGEDTQPVGRLAGPPPASRSSAGSVDSAEKKQAILSEVLRRRALSSANPPVSSTSRSPAAGNAPRQEPSTGRTPLPGPGIDDEALQARLAEMTRRASEEVRALAAGLKAAEKSLEAQRNNQYGASAP